MHNLQQQTTEDRDRDESKDSKEGKSEPLNGHDIERDTDKTDESEKFFEDEEENSTRSDLSRSDGPSEDTFQTPSASLHNLSQVQQPKEGNEEIEPEIRSETGVNTTENDQPRDSKEDEVPISGKHSEPSPQASFIYIGDGVTKNVRRNSQSADAVGSPIASLSPGNTANGNLNLTQSTDSNISRESNSSGSSGKGSVGTSTASKETVLLQPGTYDSIPSKKKMWYHVFTPSYKTRSSDFRKHFKDLPADERLIVDYSCALQKEILVQGRMYVSQNYLSFYANIFGWQTSMSIKFKDISSITKEHTALVIPNAVQVITEGDKYFFTSFVNRDSTYIMLFKLWQTALLGQNLPPKEIWKLVHACYGEVEIGSEEEENEDYISLSSTGSLANAASISTLHSISDGEDKSVDSRGGVVCSGDSKFRHGLSGAPSSSGTASTDTLKASANSNGIIHTDLIPTDLSDSSDSEEEQDVEDLSNAIPSCPAPHDDGKVVVDAVIPCNVDTLFTMLFTNSKFYLDFHTSRKTFDIHQQEWQEKDGCTSRQVSFTVTLNQRMGPKHSQITEIQTLLPVSKPGYFYAVDIESNNAGIPYADAFYVTCHFCLARVSAKQSRLIIVAQVRYRKSIWGLTKSFIEKNSWVGIDEFYSSLEKSLKEECALATSASPPSSPRGKAAAPLRRRPLRKKGPAPGIPTQTINATNASIPTVGSAAEATGIKEPPFSSIESTLILKIILSILATLLILNGFLYVKLARLEDTAGSPIFFAPQPITFTREVPQNHQQWLQLLQQQEALHRFELQKWHDILLSALKILNQAESDLESLKFQVDTYAHTRVQERYFKRKDNVDPEDFPSDGNSAADPGGMHQSHSKTVEAEL